MARAKKVKTIKYDKGYADGYYDGQNMAQSSRPANAVELANANLAGYQEGYEWGKKNEKERVKPVLKNAMQVLVYVRDHLTDIDIADRRDALDRAERVGAREYDVVDLAREIYGFIQEATE